MLNKLSLFGLLVAIRKGKAILKGEFKLWPQELLVH